MLVVADYTENVSTKPITADNLSIHERRGSILQQGKRKLSLPMKGRKWTSISSPEKRSPSISSQSNRSNRLQITSSSKRLSIQFSSPNSSSLSRMISTPNSQTSRYSPNISLKARQKKITSELQKLELKDESSDEDIYEKDNIQESAATSSRLKNIISSKFGIGGAKNKHAAAMNALLRMRPKNLQRRGSQDELRKMAFNWMEMLINRISILYKFSKAMRLHSSAQLERSARMEAEHVMRIEDRSNLRNKSIKGRNNSHKIPSLPSRPRSLLPPKYIRILYKYPESRSESDISELRVFLRSSINEFRQYSESTQISLCMSMYYTLYEKGRVILRQGQPGKNFYIILSGSLVWMQTDLDRETGEVYTSDNVMKAGEKFGEIAFLRKITRTATVVCCEDSELLMIDKELFDKYCPNLFEEQLREKMLAVRNVGLFESWSYSDLEEVLLEARLQEYPINKVVVRDSLDCPLFYLVVEGKCRVLKEINVVKMDRRQSKMGHKDIRHFHLSELPPSQYAQLQMSGNDNTEVDKRRESLSPIDSVPQMNGIITRDGRAYLQLRKLSRGDIFELTEMYKSHLSKTGGRANKQAMNFSQSLMLISNGAKLLQITKSKFKSKAGGSFLDTLYKYFIKYPGEEELIRNYREHMSWIIYKRGIVVQELAYQKAKGIKRAEKARSLISIDIMT